MSGFGDALLGDKLSQRAKGFKKGVDADEARRKREDAAVQLRKATRDEALQKKRMTSDLPGAAGAMPTVSETAGMQENDSQIIALSRTVCSDNQQ